MRTQSLCQSNTIVKKLMLLTVVGLAIVVMHTAQAQPLNGHARGAAVTHRVVHTGPVHGVTVRHHGAVGVSARRVGRVGHVGHVSGVGHRVGYVR